MSNIRKICCGGNDIVVWLHPDMVVRENEESITNYDEGEQLRVLKQQKFKQNKYKIERIEMMQMFKHISNLQDVEIKVIDNYLYRTAVHQEKTGCMSCGHQLLILMITPCGHMVMINLNPNNDYALTLLVPLNFNRFAWNVLTIKRKFVLYAKKSLMLMIGKKNDLYSNNSFLI